VLSLVPHFLYSYLSLDDYFEHTDQKQIDVKKIYISHAELAVKKNTKKHGIPLSKATTNLHASSDNATATKDLSTCKDKCKQLGYSSVDLCCEVIENHIRDYMSLFHHIIGEDIVTPTISNSTILPLASGTKESRNEKVIINTAEEKAILTIHPKAVDHVTRFAVLLIELTIKNPQENRDFFFVHVGHSGIHLAPGDVPETSMLACNKYEPTYTALAAILTAFESLSRDNLPQVYRQKWVDLIFSKFKIDCTMKEIYECRVKFRSMFHEIQGQRQRCIQKNEMQSRSGC